MTAIHFSRQSLAVGPGGAVWALYLDASGALVLAVVDGDEFIHVSTLVAAPGKRSAGASAFALGGCGAGLAAAYIVGGDMRGHIVTADGTIGKAFSLASGASGTPSVFCWPSGTDLRAEITWSDGVCCWGARYRGGVLEAPQRVDSGAGTAAEFPWATGDGAGKTWCAWRSAETTSLGPVYRIRVASRAGDTSVWTPTKIAVDGMDPSLAWMQGDLLIGYHRGWDCWLDRIASGAAKPASSTRIGTQGHFVGLAVRALAYSAAWSRWSAVGDDKRDDLRGVVARWAASLSGASTTEALGGTAGYQLQPATIIAADGRTVFAWWDASAGVPRVAWR